MEQQVLKPIYLFYGEEKYLIEDNLKKIKKAFGVMQKGINYIELGENNILDIIPNLETPAFGFEKKLIIIRDSNLFKKDTKGGSTSDIREKIESYFKENFNNFKDYNIIVFIEETAIKTLGLYKFILNNR